MFILLLRKNTFFFLKYRNYVATLVAKTEGLSESHGLSPLCNLVQDTK